MNIIVHDIAIIIIMLALTFGLFRIFKYTRLFALKYRPFQWLQDERLSRLAKVIVLALSGLTTLYFVEKNLIELFVGLFFCGLMFQVAVIEAPPAPAWEDDENDEDYRDDG